MRGGERRCSSLMRTVRVSFELSETGNKQTVEEKKKNTFLRNEILMIREKNQANPKPWDCSGTGKFVMQFQSSMVDSRSECDGGFNHDLLSFA